ncbi:chlorophyll a-b binding protein of LHCII type 1 [Dorcoceras hygrometricum]|uniref:Chlorophyll a-b binding protein of LHCII type 1 n=1 Tax=Dorcoceras hygrometricum TaxID=472368 RepID=A0A2Z6ZQV8_9LAMI|nr:chlorophyll a-b binding protein of LHCII type 1 [Dorcoceras hygrometricum]
MRRPAGRVARNQQRRPASTALHLRTIASDFHRDTAPSARQRRATIAQVSAVMHTLMRTTAPDVAQKFVRGGLLMVGRHAWPARMASRVLWRARWTAARGGCRPMIFQRFCRFSFSDLKFKTLDTIQAIRID